MVGRGRNVHTERIIEKGEGMKHSDRVKGSEIKGKKKKRFCEMVGRREN